MNRTNYALMAALYDTNGAGLYQDVYFPIIKYAIGEIHRRQREAEMYYELDNLQLIISTKFGFPIPAVVLKQCVNIIGKKGLKDIELTIFENGARFLVRKNWDISIDDSIECKHAEIERSFEELEEGYKAYLDYNSIEDDKSFLDLVKDNAVDIYNYFEDGGTSTSVNETYFHISRYLRQLQKTNFQLFTVANNIFWGSVIAGFLQRERNLDIKSNNKVRYYLDTSLVMAVLDLASEENVTYAQELVEIINSSSGYVYVHGATLKEVDSIIFSVEKSKKPRFNSSIESAYYRRNLTPTKLMRIRTNLVKLIQEKDVIVEPLISDKIYKEICDKYKNNHNVKELRKARNEYDDGFASIHDIFMTEFVRSRRGNIQISEEANCSFVSLNIDLMTFIKERYSPDRFPYIIHPSKVIMDLWIHNQKPANLKSTALVEAMSRCMALNNRDVRIKLGIVAKYKRDVEFTPEEYASIEVALINRSKSIIHEIDEIESDNNPEQIDEHIRKIVRLAVEEERQRKEQLESKQDEVNVLIGQFEDRYEKIKKDFDQSELKSAEKENKIKLFKRLSEIKDEFYPLKEDVKALEIKRKSSINLSNFYILFIVEVIALLVIVAGIAILIYNYGGNLMASIASGVISGSILIGAGIGLLNIMPTLRKLHILNPQKSKQTLKEEQLTDWDNKNPEYEEKARRLAELEKEIESLEAFMP